MYERSASPSDGVLGSIARRVISCRWCPRLVEYRERVARERKRAFREWDYWGRPVPGFGDPNARVVLLGLAPAAHGGNRTGRVFTGDLSARFLTVALHEVGFANQPTSESRNDGLSLHDLYITAAVKCVPPGNWPTRDETANCFSYLREELVELRQMRVALALGHIAFKAFLRYATDVVGRPVRLPFRHGTFYELGAGLPVLVASYHVSPRNTNTGRLTREAFVDLLWRVRRRVGLL